MTETLGEARVNSLHDLDVFGGDAEVVEVDLKVPICEVFDLEVFVVIIDGGVAVGRNKGVAVEGGASVEVLASEALGFRFFFAAMWSCRGRTAGGRQNCWCKTLSVTKRSQQPRRRETGTRERKTLAQRQHKN